MKCKVTNPRMVLKLTEQFRDRAREIVEEMKEADDVTTEEEVGEGAATNGTGNGSSVNSSSSIGDGNGSSSSSDTATKKTKRTIVISACSLEIRNSSTGIIDASSVGPILRPAGTPAADVICMFLRNNDGSVSSKVTAQTLEDATRRVSAQSYACIHSSRIELSSKDDFVDLFVLARAASCPKNSFRIMSIAKSEFYKNAIVLSTKWREFDFSVSFCVATTTRIFSSKNGTIAPAAETTTTTSEDKEKSLLSTSKNMIDIAHVVGINRKRSVSLSATAALDSGRTTTTRSTSAAGIPASTRSTRVEEEKEEDDDDTLDRTCKHAQLYGALRKHVEDLTQAAHLSIEASVMLQAATKLSVVSSLSDAVCSADHAFDDLCCLLDKAHAEAATILRHADRDAEFALDSAEKEEREYDDSQWKRLRPLFRRRREKERKEEGDAALEFAWRAKRATRGCRLEARKLCSLAPTPTSRTAVFSVSHVLLSKVRTDELRLALGERVGTARSPHRSSRWSIASFDPTATGNEEIATTVPLISAVLLKCLHELPEPLVPLCCHNRVWRALAKETESDRRSALRSVLHDRSIFPAENFNALQQIVVFAARLVGSSSTELHANRIVRCLGCAVFRFDPSTSKTCCKRIYASLFADYGPLLRPPKPVHIGAATVAMRIFVSHSQYIFAPERRRSRRAGLRMPTSPIASGAPRSRSRENERRFRDAVIHASEHLRIRERSWDIGQREMSSCYLCQKKFNIRRRRHHCRVCRALVCSSCSSHRAHFFVEPNAGAHSSARFNADRACDVCAEWLFRFQMRRSYVSPGLALQRLNKLVVWALERRVPLFLFQRHGKSLANVAEEGALLSGSGFMANIQRINPKDARFRDAALTPEAIVTAKYLGSVVGHSLHAHTSSILVSPLTRAVQTAAFTFGPSAHLRVHSNLSEQMKTQSDRGIENDSSASASNPIRMRYIECGIANRVDLDNVAEGKWWFSDGPIEWEKDVKVRIEKARASLMDLRDNAAERPVAVVGHSGFWKMFFGPAFRKMKNLEIRPVVLLRGEFVPIGWALTVTNSASSNELAIEDVYEEDHECDIRRNRGLLSHVDGAVEQDYVEWRWGQGPESGTGADAAVALGDATASKSRTL
eukprot:g551.t1